MGGGADDECADGDVGGGGDGDEYLRDHELGGVERADECGGPDGEFDGAVAGFYYECGVFVCGVHGGDDYGLPEQCGAGDEFEREHVYYFGAGKLPYFRDGELHECDGVLVFLQCGAVDEYGGAAAVVGVG